jgi:hypothetical protein
MPFDWTEYLLVARFLQSHGGSGFSQEAAFRCAVSRAYYAAFCHARNYARDHQGFRPTGGPQDHRLVREHFRQRGQANVARRLDQLRQWRNACDYDDVVGSFVNMLTLALADAQRVLSNLT